MKHLFATVLVAAAVALAGCGLAPALGLQEELDLATEHGTTALAKAIDTHCLANGANVDLRRKNLEQLNAKTRYGDMFALDCVTVGTPGQPDFTVSPAQPTPN